MVQNPVLFITFVRPEYARRSWDAIKAAQPQKLYFYSNKGREEIEGEIERNEEIRSYITEIDWECELHTWFRDKTVNVYESLYGAISWLFENEEQGIILEEDCVASLAFFDYCDKLLPKYKEDYRIWIISGDNFIEDKNVGNFDYFFSQNMQIYGWASWRSRWLQIDWNKNLNVDLIKKGKIVESIICTKKRQKFLLKDLRGTEAFVNKTKCWDCVFLVHGILNNSLSVVPSKNLVENIGIIGEHNNKKKKSIYNASVSFKGDKYRIDKVPAYISPNLFYEKIMYRKLERFKYNIINKVLYKLNSILGRN